MNQFEKLKTEVESIQQEIFAPILSILNDAEDDATKYYNKGVRSAGNRLKKKMQEIDEMTNDVYDNVQNYTFFRQKKLIPMQKALEI
jgi:uncharacterized protein (DUF2164 family)